MTIPESNHDQSRDNVDLDALSRALEASIKAKNTLTVAEFKPFHPLFKKDSDTASDEYRDLCVEWTSRISAYDPVTIVNPNTDEVVLKLPPSSNRVEDINATQNPDIVVNKFNHALATNHPLRSDKEDALFLFKATIEVAQDTKRLEKEATTFAKLAEDAGFEGHSVSGDIVDDATLEKLEWT